MLDVLTWQQGSPRVMGLKRTLSLGGDLAHLPQLGGCDGAGAHKAAQAGAVKHERYWHVPCMRTRASDASPALGPEPSCSHSSAVCDVTWHAAGQAFSSLCTLQAQLVCMLKQG